MKRLCTDCGTANDGTALFCRSCGTSLAPAEAEPQTVLPFQMPNPPALGASRQKTFTRALLGGAAVALAGGIGLWWAASRPSTTAQHITMPAAAPASVPAVITPPPLVKPVLLPAADPAAATRQPTSAEQAKHRPRNEPSHRPHAAARTPKPAPPPAVAAQIAAPPVATTPAVPAPSQQSNLADQVAQCKARYAGITHIISRQRCLWQYCDGHWGQAGCPPKYGQDSDPN